MAFDREFLTGIGLSEEQVEAIMEAHQDTVDYLTGESEGWKAKSEQYKAAAAEVERLRNGLGDEAGWKAKYEELHAKLEAAKTYDAKESAYRDLLRTAGMSGKYIDLVVKFHRDKIDALDVQEGKVRDAGAVVDSIRAEWPEFMGQQ